MRSMAVPFLFTITSVGIVVTDTVAPRGGFVSRTPAPGAAPWRGIWPMRDGRRGAAITRNKTSHEAELASAA